MSYLLVDHWRRRTIVLKSISMTRRTVVKVSFAISAIYCPKSEAPSIILMSSYQTIYELFDRY